MSMLCICSNMAHGLGLLMIVFFKVNEADICNSCLSVNLQVTYLQTDIPQLKL